MRLTRKPKVRAAVGSNPALDSLVAVRNSSPGRPVPCEGNLVAVAGGCGGLMVKHPWPLLEISLSDFRRLATLNIIPTYLPDDRSSINCIWENTSVVPSSNFLDFIHCDSRICLGQNIKALVSRWKQICPLKINIFTLNAPISTNEVCVIKLAIKVCFENHSGLIHAIF